MSPASRRRALVDRTICPADRYPDGQWDHIPPRHDAAVADLTVTGMPAGHWLPLERKAEHIRAIRAWLQSGRLRRRRWA